MGKLCTFLFGVSLTWNTLKYAYWQLRWQLNKRKGEKALKERNERYRGREEELFGPVDKELEIIACTIEGLRKGMHEGRFTCVQVIKVYARRCYIIGRDLELSGDELYEQAIEEAVKADKEISEARANGTLD